MDRSVYPMIIATLIIQGLAMAAVWLSFAIAAKLPIFQVNSTGL
jgi:hypothetical protein